MDSIKIEYQFPEIHPYRIHGNAKDGYSVCRVENGNEIMFSSGEKPIYLKSVRFKTLSEAKAIVAADADGTLKKLEEKLSRQLKIVQRVIVKYDKENDWIEDYRCGKTYEKGDN
jgi:hypothetical protein